MSRTRSHFSSSPLMAAMSVSAAAFAVGDAAFDDVLDAVFPVNDVLDDVDAVDDEEEGRFASDFVVFVVVFVVVFAEPFLFDEAPVGFVDTFLTLGDLLSLTATGGAGVDDDVQLSFQATAPVKVTFRIR